MSVSAIEIVELALRQVGVYAPSDTGADASQVEAALSAFQMLMHEEIGSGMFWWFMPQSQIIPLALGVSTYELNDLTDDNLQFVTDVFLRDAQNNERRVTLIRKSSFDQYRSLYTGNGEIEWCYVERNSAPNLTLIRTPGVAGLTLRVEGQGYAPDVEKDHGEVPTEFPDSWSRYLYKRLALDIGTGIVVNLPDRTYSRIENEMKIAKKKLDVFSKRENVRRMRVTQMDNP